MTNGGPMPRKSLLAVLPFVSLGLFILMSAAVRPVIPPDETRYLTVAWEMLLRGDFIRATVNFADYSDKPPLLFWLIDLFWAVFGASRPAALAAIFAISSSVLLLIRRFVVELYPGEDDIRDRAIWLTLGNGFFIVYSGLILFDLLLTLCVLAAFLALIVHARAPSGRQIVLAGIFMGLGVLAKGPVAYLFLIFPIAAYPLWRSERQQLSRSRFWKASGLAFVISLVVVAAWVAPLLIETKGGFAHTLLWDQTAGRISGTRHGSHARAIWFYLPLLPLIGLPWLFSPLAWRDRWQGGIGRTAAAFRDAWREQYQIRLVVLWIGPVVVAFSLISGKQPHYLVPLLPAVIAGTALFMRFVRLRAISLFTLAALAAVIAGQSVASFNVFRQFDLRPLADVMADHAGPVAIVGSYEGQLNFLARRTSPVATIAPDGAAAWLAAHPDGMLVALFLYPKQKLPGRTLFSMSFRNRYQAAAAVAEPAAAKAPKQ